MRRRTSPARGRNKFGAKSVYVDGIRFSSKKEAKRYRELSLLELAGKITGLELQPEFELACGDTPVCFANGRQAKYVGDFRYRDLESGQVVVEDTKGMDTPVSKLKRAFVKAQYGIEVVVL